MCKNGKNSHAKFGESLSKCSTVHPKIAPWHNISASHSGNLAGMFFHFSVDNFAYHEQEVCLKWSKLLNVLIYLAEDVLQSGWSLWPKSAPNPPLSRQFGLFCFGERRGKEIYHVSQLASCNVSSKGTGARKSVWPWPYSEVHVYF